MNNRLRVFAAAFSLLLVYSCTDYISQDEGLAVSELTAYVDNGYLTKTGIEDDGFGKFNVVWKSGNAISLFFNSGDSGGSKFTTTSTGSRATFTGTINAVSGDLSETGGTAYFWATYPYNASAICDGNSITTSLRSLQPAYANNVSDDLLVTIGRAQNLSIYFRNTYTMIEFTLTQENITKITFSGNNNESVAGEFQASFDGSNNVVSTPTANAVKTVEISPAESLTFASGTKYYFVFLPGTFSKGYTLKFTRSDGYEATFKRESAFTFAVGKFYTMYNKDSGLAFSAPDPLPVPTAVDLGLSVKWASFNLGASSPEEEGYYYAWGETERKAVFFRDNYKWKNGPSKYNGTDNLITLQLEDDVAHFELGGSWRIPTKEDVEELFSNCTATYINIGNVVGFLLTSTLNGNTLFFPSVGEWEGLNFYGYYPHFRTSTLYPTAGWSSINYNSSWCAGLVNSDYSNFMYDGRPRYVGMQIRPICE